MLKKESAFSLFSNPFYNWKDDAKTLSLSLSLRTVLLTSLLLFSTFKLYLTYQYMRISFISLVLG